MKSKDLFDMVLFIGLCFVSVLLFILFFSERAYSCFHHMYIHQREMFFYSGFAFSFFTALFSLCLYFQHRESYYTVKMSSTTSRVSKTLLNELVDVVMEKHFPSMNIESGVDITKDNAIWIEAKVARMSFSEQEELLERLEKKIGKELYTSLAYKVPFYLTLKMK